MKARRQNGKPTRRRNRKPTERQAAFAAALVRRILEAEAESRQLAQLHGWTYQPGFWPFGFYAASAREAGYSDRGGNARRLAWKARQSRTVQRELRRMFTEAGAGYWARSA